MSFVELLTPKHTEEIKPGLFIQKVPRGYRQIYPVAWNGVINWKRFFLGHNFWKNLFIFLVILLVVYGYFEGTNECRKFQEDPCAHLQNITKYCYEKYSISGDFKSGEQDSYYLQGSTP